MTFISRSSKQWIAVAVLSAFLPLSIGCIGDFRLVRKVYKFNLEVSQDKWIQELTFVLLALLPYGLATTLDALIFNSIEFWTGESIITSDTTRRVVGEHGEIASATFHPDGSVDLLVVDADGKEHTLLLERDGYNLTAIDESGRAVARAELHNGRLQTVQLR